MYRELFVDPSPARIIKSKSDPLSVSTPLYVEYEIAQSLGMTYSEFRKLPRKERRTWFLWRILSAQKEEHAYKKAREEAERQRESKPSYSPLPKVRR